jgi:hypothetical protein
VRFVIVESPGARFAYYINHLKGLRNRPFNGLGFWGVESPTVVPSAHRSPTHPDSGPSQIHEIERILGRFLRNPMAQPPYVEGEIADKRFGRVEKVGEA